MLLLLPLQLPGFGTFAGESAPAVPERMTYSGTTSGVMTGTPVCDPDWNGWSGSLVVASATVACNGACAKKIGEHKEDYDWCYTTSDSSAWCWCAPLDCNIVGVPRNRYFNQEGTCNACEAPGLDLTKGTCTDVACHRTYILHNGACEVDCFYSIDKQIGTSLHADDCRGKIDVGVPDWY